MAVISKKPMEGLAMKAHFLNTPSVLAVFGFACLTPTADASDFSHSAFRVHSPTLSTLDEASRADGWDRGRRHRGFPYGHRRYDDNIDAGDVIAGVLLIGGALAVVDAISSRSRNDRDRYRYPEDAPAYPEADYRPSPVRDPSASGGIQRAIESCTSEIERMSRIATINSARRSGAGWSIGGELRDGGIFSCEIDGAGRIRDVDFGRDDSNAYGDLQPYSERNDRPGDDYYAEARARYGIGSPDDRVNDVPPSDLWTEDETTQQWERGEGDDRYDTANAAEVAVID